MTWASTRTRAERRGRTVSSYFWQSFSTSAEVNVSSAYAKRSAHDPKIIFLQNGPIIMLDRLHSRIQLWAEGGRGWCTSRRKSILRVLAIRLVQYSHRVSPIYNPPNNYAGCSHDGFAVGKLVRPTNIGDLESRFSLKLDSAHISLITFSNSRTYGNHNEKNKNET